MFETTYIYWCSIAFGPVAQLGERLVCIQEVVGSIPVGSTTHSCELSRAYSSVG